jgi:hypothetical protein
MPHRDSIAYSTPRLYAPVGWLSSCSESRIYYSDDQCTMKMGSSLAANCDIHILSTVVLVPGGGEWRGVFGES